MNTVLKDLVHHNVWATRTLMDVCEGLSEDQQRWSTEGAVSDIRGTLEHLVDSEVAYFRLLTGISVEPPDGKSTALSVTESRQWIAQLDSHWEAFLQSGTDADEVFTATSSDSGDRSWFHKGVVLAQVFNHANVHREQVCNILTVHGIQPPEIDPWTFAFSTGRGGPVVEELS